MTKSIKRQKIEQNTKSVFWGILISSMLTPWLVGLAIKVYLMTQAAPTVPIKYFIVMVLPLSVWWAIPFIVFAFVARTSLNRRALSKKERDSRLTVILVAHGFGLFGMVLVFREVFVVWDVVWVFLPVQLAYGAAIVIGAAVGWLFTKAI